MCTQTEIQMQEAAMKNPADALQAIGVSSESSTHTVAEAFLTAYILVNGGKSDNMWSRRRVNEAAILWREQSQIPEWLARACVLAQLTAAE